MVFEQDSGLGIVVEARPAIRQQRRIRTRKAHRSRSSVIGVLEVRAVSRKERANGSSKDTIPYTEANQASMKVDMIRKRWR